MLYYFYEYTIAKRHTRFVCRRASMAYRSYHLGSGLENDRVVESRTKQSSDHVCHHRNIEHRRNIGDLLPYLAVLSK